MMLKRFAQSLLCSPAARSQVVRSMASVNTALPALSDRALSQKESVWVEFIQLALEHKPINLGQGFPDYAAPKIVTDALTNVGNNSNVLLQQYTRGYGHPRLVNALSKLYSQLVGQQINPNKEVLVTVGAYEALFCAFMGITNPGDEVIVIEPFFDCYAPMIELAGGVPVYVPLRPSVNANASAISSGDWKLDMQELESKFTNKTKAIVINTPHNPLGKVFTRDELMAIGDLCKKHNIIAIMDEVYEWITFDGNQHVRMASLPGMWERTITIGSAGKTFSVTGWKLGWAYGPEHLIKALQLIHQNTVYTCATPLQEAVAMGFEAEIPKLGSNQSYWKELSDDLKQKRDKIVQFLTSVNMKPTIPQGGYFLLADFSDLANRLDFSSVKGGTQDYRFTKWLTIEKKLQGIPPSFFYSEGHRNLIENYIRFCYFKKDETLDQAADVIRKLKQSLEK
ncbi:kynurenine aminotransferase isoform X2 [Brevipalpus obovatus]|uniref:kynurenine aminotransferase isoform X2 n=1 Tax=Brevipalpus obovatus TaxID=246614 RepID=UPI003D9F9DF5